MDQDIHFQKLIDWAAAAAVTHYMIVPYRCTMRNITAICQTSIDVDETITVTYGTTIAAATAVGVMTMPTGAGGEGVWVADTTTGDTVMAADGFLKFVTSDSAGSTSQCDLDIEFDPYAR
jgi:hypothetical protein